MFQCVFSVFFSLGFVMICAERKRRIYDQYGKDGLLGQNDRSHRSRRHDYDDFDFGFVFRSPDEVFREFFGVNSPFADLFGDGVYFLSLTQFLICNNLLQ